MIGDGNNGIYQYTLSTPFSLTSASYDSVYFDLTLIDASPNGIEFSDDGHRMFSIGGDEKINQYRLLTACDITTAYLE